MDNYNSLKYENAENELRELITVAEDIDKNVHKLRQSQVKFMISLVLFVTSCSLVAFLSLFYFRVSELVVYTACIAGLVISSALIYFRYKTIISELRRESYVLKQLIELIENQKKIIFSTRDDAYLNPALEIRIRRLDFNVFN
jgi:hypothetical protein